MAERELTPAERLKPWEEALEERRTFSNKDLFDITKALIDIWKEDDEPDKARFGEVGVVSGSIELSYETGKVEDVWVVVFGRMDSVEAFRITYDSITDEYKTFWDVDPIESILAEETFFEDGDTQLEVSLSQEQSRTIVRNLLFAHNLSLKHQ